MVTGSPAEVPPLAAARAACTWGSADSRYGDYLQRMASLLQFDDLLLIDSSGQVVFSVAKGVDLGADLVDGPYSLTSLGAAFDTAMSTNQGLDTVVFSDFKRYSPALGRPVAWAVVPLAGQDQVVGAIAVQLPVDRISYVGNAAALGLGCHR